MAHFIQSTMGKNDFIGKEGNLKRFLFLRRNFYKTLDTGYSFSGRMGVNVLRFKLQIMVYF